MNKLFNFNKKDDDMWAEYRQEKGHDNGEQKEWHIPKRVYVLTGVVCFTVSFLVSSTIRTKLANRQFETSEEAYESTDSFEDSVVLPTEPDTPSPDFEPEAGSSAEEPLTVEEAQRQLADAELNLMITKMSYGESNTPDYEREIARHMVIYAEIDVIEAKIALLKAKNPGLKQGDPAWEEYGWLVQEYDEKTDELIGLSGSQTLDLSPSPKPDPGLGPSSSPGPDPVRQTEPDWTNSDPADT